MAADVEHLSRPCSVEGTCAPARGSAGKLPLMRPSLALGHPVSSTTTPTAGFGASWARCEPDSEGRRPAQCSTLWPPAHQKHRSRAMLEICGSAWDGAYLPG